MPFGKTLSNILLVLRNACSSYKEAVCPIQSKNDNATLPQSEGRNDAAAARAEEKRKKCKPSCDEKCIWDGLH